MLQLRRKFSFLEAKQDQFELNMATKTNKTICGQS